MAGTFTRASTKKAVWIVEGMVDVEYSRIGVTKELWRESGTPLHQERLESILLGELLSTTVGTHGPLPPDRRLIPGVCSLEA